MENSREQIVMRRATVDELPGLDAIRAAAFEPVFASFRGLLGDDTYELSQARDDAAQGPFLASMFEPESVWEVHAAELDGVVVGFVSVRLDRDSLVGELGLNAVDPAHVGRGIGTMMYEHAIARMQEAGMRVATVGTGGDPSHAPARRAYEKVGFDVGIPTVWLFRRL